ncbi:MAG TPA: hypothetical protein VGO73_04000 [Pyrinomonadaceae bacterium]|nr:hypothetical protein [Pyrinomonadaceae bacterium]
MSRICVSVRTNAWKHDNLIADASRLLEEMKGDRIEIWQQVEPYLIPGSELKAQFAFADLWEALRGKD